MYKLTLTANERRAIDWIGNRYSNGDDLFKLLWLESKQDGQEREWDSQEEITFLISENVAWQISENAEQEGFPCFAPELCDKLYSFLNKIV